MTMAFNTPDQLDITHPWPGLRSYQEHDSTFFFGRREEIEELLRRIKRHPVTVLYGKSGLGKTSLLQAGLFPALRVIQLLPVYIRLDFTQENLLEQVDAHIRQVAEDQAIDIAPRAGGVTMWQYLHEQAFWSQANDLLIPVLCFDQFEEAFTLGGDNHRIESFFDELGWLIENVIPPQLMDLPEGDLSDEIHIFTKRQPFRLVLSMREDKLSELHSLEKRAPSLRANMMPLLPLKREQATEIVLLPAADSGIIDPSTAERIVDFVGARSRDALERRVTTKGDKFFDPAIVSVVCRELNMRRIENGRYQITIDLLESQASAIIDDFYRNSTANVSDSTLAFVETSLTTPDGRYRTQVARATAEQSLKIPSDEIEALIANRILRVDISPANQVEYLELTHDILIESVVKGRAERERKRQEREGEVTRRSWMSRVLLGCVLLGLVFGIAAYLIELQANKRELYAIKKEMDTVQQTLFRAKAATEQAEAAANRANSAEQSSRARTAELIGKEAQLKRRNEGLTMSLLMQDLLNRSRLSSSRSLASALMDIPEDRRDWEWGYALRMTQLPEMILKGHAREVVWSEFNRNGARVVTASWDDTAVVWDSITGIRLMTLVHPQDVEVARFSPDDRYIFTGCDDGIVRRWPVPPAVDSSTSITIQPEDANVMSIPVARSIIRSLDFSDDNTCLAVASDDGMVRLYEMQPDSVVPRQELRYFQGARINSVAFAPDSLHLIAAGIRWQPVAWFHSQGAWSRFEFEGIHDDALGYADFSPDGLRVLSASYDGSIGIWDIRKRSLIRRIEVLNSRIISARLLPGENSLCALAVADGSIQIRSLEGDIDPIIGKPHTGVVASVNFTQDYTRLITSSYDNSAAILSVRHLISSPQSNAVVTLPHQSSVKPAHFDDSGQYVATGCLDGTVHLWNAATGEAIRDFRHDDSGKAQTAAVSSVAFIPGRDAIISAGWNGLMKVWSTAGKGELLSVKRAGDLIVSMDVSPMGQRAALVLDDTKSVQIWDISDPIDIPEDPLASGTLPSEGAPQCVAFDPWDSRSLHVGDNDGFVWHARLVDDRLLFDRNPLRPHERQINFIEPLVEDGHKSLLTASRDRWVRLTDLEGTRTLAFDLTDRSEAICADLNPNATRLVTVCSADAAPILWDAEDGFQITSLTGHDEPLNSAEFSPDGRMLLTSSHDGTVRIWRSIPWADLETFSDESVAQSEEDEDSRVRTLLYLRSRWREANNELD